MIILPSVNSGITSSSLRKGLITNGLVFHLDPSDPACYSGSGTSCNDLTSINGVGTLSNITFSADKAFQMNSTTSRVFFNRNYTNITNSHTFMFVAEIPFTGPAFYPNIMSSLNENFGGVTLYSFQDAPQAISSYISEDSGNALDEILGSVGSFPVKVLAACTISDTTLKNYINGILMNTSSPRGGGNVNAQSNITFGYDLGTLFTTIANIKIYNGLIYNRPLSDAEVFQNYSFLKSKYGL